METSASFEARSAPSSYPTHRAVRSNCSSHRGRTPTVAGSSRVKTPRPFRDRNTFLQGVPQAGQALNLRGVAMTTRQDFIVSCGTIKINAQPAQ